jgi:hypothetical protein
LRAAAYRGIWADLVSCLSLAAMAVVAPASWAMVGLAAILAASRGLRGQRTAELVPGSGAPRDAQPRLWMVGLGFAVGAAVAGLAAGFGVAGGSWLLSITFAAAALGMVWPATGAQPEPASAATAMADPVARRAAAILSLSSAAAGAGLVMVLVAWQRDVVPTPAAFGLLTATVILAALGSTLRRAGAVSTGWLAAALLGLLCGGGATLWVTGLAASALLVLVAAGLAGVGLATLLPIGPADRLPNGVQTGSYLGLAAGTVAGAALVGWANLPVAVLVGGGCYLVGLLVPIFDSRSYALLNPPAAAGAAAPPARMSVILAYSDGQWLVEVRRGWAMFGPRYAVAPAEALRMLAVLDVPSVYASAERALNADRIAAGRQADRLRSELAGLEQKLSGIAGMASLGANRPQAPTSRPAEVAPSSPDPGPADPSADPRR